MGSEKKPPDEPPVDYRGRLLRLGPEAAQVASMFGMVVALVKWGTGAQLALCVAVLVLSTWPLKHTPRPPLPGFDG